MSDIRTEVRQMLERRAADIDSPYETGAGRQGARPAPLRPTGLLSSGRRWWRPSAIAAVVAILAGLGLNYGLTRDGSPETSTVETSTSPAGPPTEAEPPVTTGPDQSDDVVPGRPSDAEPRGFDETVAALPAGVNLIDGPLVYAGQAGSTADQITRDYLNDRMPFLQYALSESERAGPLVVYRWSNRLDGEKAGFTGSVIVRDDLFVPGVVAATTDQIDTRRVQRTIQSVSALVIDSDINLLVADVFNVRGEILPGSANPDGFNGGSQPIFGTAGHTETDLLEFEMATSPIPVVVRIQHVGGTMLSISEFALEAVGFVDECGNQPPIRINVGDLLSQQQAGTSPHATNTLLTNQSAWHYPGDSASIEILWPANPTLTSRVAPETFEESHSLGFTAPTNPTDGTSPADPGPARHVVLFLGGSAADPCSLVQVNVYGDDDVVEWWTTAISGEWGFGLPLSIADLDPAIGPNGTGAEPPSPAELIVAFMQAAERPTVAATGSCDGLPDAPPRTGPGLDTITIEPSEALALFLATTPSPDLLLPPNGYTEVVIDDTTISYMISYDDDPFVVIDLSDNGNGWSVEGWTAAAC